MHKCKSAKEAGRRFAFRHLASCIDDDTHSSSRQTNLLGVQGNAGIAVID
jgi:hypothetical protein